MDYREVERPSLNRNTILLRKLSAAVNGHAATATFACGGSVPITDFAAVPGELLGCRPVKIRCETPLVDNDVSITFPQPHTEDHFNKQLQALLRQCGRATFGIGGRDVFDEAYRKADKLDASPFSSNFHPYDCGILHSVQQILLPSTVRNSSDLLVSPQPIKAELYALNVYSGPTGRFRPHVDTPRGPTQFGSLVVCLPCYYEGGTLRVKHRGQIIDFDWANASLGSIHWAAFYGDCEHEVLEVKNGHRVTSTYNLYYSSVADFDHRVHLTNQLPLYSIVHDMLEEPNFLRRGGTLGFFCHHQYAHAHGSARKSLPRAFKGVDLAIYSVFHSLRLEVGVYPIIKNKSESMGGMSMKDLYSDSYDECEGDHVELFLERLVDQPEDEAGDEDFYKEDEEEYRTIVGKALHGPTFDKEEDDSGEPVTQAWPHDKISKIVWMNDPVHRDFAHAGLAYGNQAELNCQFSAASILVVVPPSSERLSPASTGGVLDIRRPALSAYTGRVHDAPRRSADSPSGDTAAFTLLPGPQTGGRTVIDLT